MCKIIMAVDDEKHVLASLKRMFRGQDYEFVAFQSPVEALNALQDLKPHVVISDKRMPHIEGVDFLTRVSEMLHCSLRILLTGHPNTERDYRNPVDRIIEKPWNNGKLEHEINRTHVLPGSLAIPLEEASGPVECSLCGQFHAQWEIRFADFSEYVCNACYGSLIPYGNSFSAWVMMNQMMGNVV